MTDTSQVREIGAPRRALIVIRYVLPGIVVLAGLLAAVVLGSANAAEGGAAVIGAGLSIALLNFLYRLGVGGETERDAEDAARDYYTAHGRWPDEEPAQAPAADFASLGRPASVDDRLGAIDYRPAQRTSSSTRATSKKCHSRTAPGTSSSPTE
jgi:hypothetical protein